VPGRRLRSMGNRVRQHHCARDGRRQVTAYCALGVGAVAEDRGTCLLDRRLSRPDA
jgi:hypothetical protein